MPFFSLLAGDFHSTCTDVELTASTLNFLGSPGTVTSSEDVSDGPRLSHAPPSSEGILNALPAARLTAQGQGRDDTETLFTRVRRRVHVTGSRELGQDFCQDAKERKCHETSFHVD